MSTEKVGGGSWPSGFRYQCMREVHGYLQITSGNEDEYALSDSVDERNLEFRSSACSHSLYHLMTCISTQS